MIANDKVPRTEKSWKADGGKLQHREIGIHPSDSES